MTGRPLVLSWLAAHADALVLAWHPGTEGGHAVADVLLGDVAPSGRLPVSLPRATGQIPVNYDHKPTSSPVDPSPTAAEGRYRDAPDAPLFPFGFGLSYGRVEYEDLVVPASVAAGEPVEVAVTVASSADRTIVETVQVYLRDPVAAIARPVRELVAAVRVSLAPGERRRVSVALDDHALGYHDATGTWRVDDGRYDVIVGPDSSHGLRASFERTTATGAAS
jgi:beta-glucosidase